MQTVFFRFPGRHCETHSDDTPLLSGVSSTAEEEGRRNVIPAADAMEPDCSGTEPSLAANGMTAPGHGA